MRSITIFLALAAAVLAAGPAAAGVDPEQGLPAVEVPQFRYEFESVVEGSEVVHTFVLKNRGTAPLEIQRVRTG